MNKDTVFKINKEYSLKDILRFTATPIVKPSMKGKVSKPAKDIKLKKTVEKDLLDRTDQ